MCWSSVVRSVDLPGRRFTVELKHAAVVGMARLAAFLAGQGPPAAPHDCIHALDAVLRATPAATRTPLGSSFFTGRGALPLSAGSEIWLGYHQSVRPAHGRLLVNVDVSAARMQKAGAVTELAAAVAGVPLGQIGRAHLRALRAELAGG
jgi:eukaryotic translation initiation factor 2C